MNDSKSLVILKRFLKGFVATAIPIAANELTKGYDLSNPADLKKFLLALITPLVAGLLLAGEKLYSWKEPETPVAVNETESATKSSSKGKKKKA